MAGWIERNGKSRRVGERKESGEVLRRDTARKYRYKQRERKISRVKN